MVFFFFFIANLCLDLSEFIYYILLTMSCEFYLKKYMCVPLFEFDVLNYVSIYYYVILVSKAGQVNYYYLTS